jgi:hypothetical protein
LPVSATEWIPSDSIAVLPVIADAPNFVTAITAFAIIAAITARVLPAVMRGLLVVARRFRRRGVAHPGPAP